MYKEYANIHKPKLPFWILKFFADAGYVISVWGDLEELYTDKANQQGRLPAFLWLWWQVLRSIPLFLIHSVHWRVIMLKNALMITFRNFKRRKGFTLINLAGLSIGMACCILIFFYVHYEFSYDRTHEDADSTYRVLLKLGNTYRGKSHINGTTGALAPAMKAYFPEVLHAARVEEQRRAIINYKDKYFKETRFFFADPDFLSMFGVQLIHGNQQRVLENPFSILISQEMAFKYFGKENPLGKRLILNNEHDYQVTGIFQNVPDNTHLKFDFLASFSSFIEMQGEERINEWARFTNKTYFQLRKDADVTELGGKLQNFYMGKLPQRIQDSGGGIVIQPVTQIHFYDEAIGEFEPGRDVRTVTLFMVIGFFILLIACCNYMNLSTARSFHRAREVGLRKVVGASRSTLIKQFMGESFILTFVSFTLSLFLVQLLLPIFSHFMGVDLSSVSLGNPRLLLGLVGIVITIGFVAGSYPAFFLSSFHPIRILRGQIKMRSRGASVFRNGLVTLQFSISIALIICTMVILKQLHFIRNQDLGYDKEHVLTIPGSPLLESHSYETIKHELMQYPRIVDMTCSSELHINIGSGGYVDWESRSEDDKLTAHMLSVDYNFFDFYGIEIVEGRAFSKDFITDKNNAYILNEKAVKEIGWEAPIGKKFSEDLDMEREGPVIGVVKDFHYAPLHLEIQPLHIRLMDPPWGWLSVKIGGQNIPGTLAFLEAKWKEYGSEYPFEYRFLDDRLNGMYQSEQKLRQVFNGFAFLAVFIACLGLFGLASFASEQRSKEIGIRKVLGASIHGILILFSNAFLKWVLVANVIAWPIAYFAMNQWLRNFAYHIDLGIGPFLLSGLGAMIIALFTIGFLSIKTALTNPAEVLKYE